MNVIEHELATNLVALSLYELNIKDHGGEIRDGKVIKPGEYGCLLSHHTIDSETPLWWRCANYPDHVYHYHKMSIKDKIATFGQGCAKCSRLVVVENKFSSVQEVQAWWDWEKNAITPDKLCRTNKHKHHFVCKIGHAFEMSCTHFGRGQRCSYCSGQQPLAGFNTFDLVADAKEWWDYEENDKLGIKIDNITCGASKTVNFKCPNGHKYSTKCHKFTIGQRCNICYCERLPNYEEAFVNVPGAMEWWDSDMNNKLGYVVENMFKSTQQRAYFKCPIDHSFDLSLSEFTSGVRCGVCSGHRALPGFNTFDLVADAKEWWDYEENDKLGIKITSYTKSARRKVHFRCPKGHKFVTKCSKFYEGRRCPVCAGRKLVPGVNTFDTTPDAKEWWDYEENDKKKLVINNITRSAPVRVHFKCPKGHKFATKCSHFTAGSRCGMCSFVGYSKIAIEYMNRIAEKYDIYIQHGENVGEYDIPTTRYRADGYVEINGVKIIIEFHGVLYHGFHGLERQDEISPFHKKKMTFGDLYQQTVKKENTIRALGYKLVVMWEDDYKQVREKYANGDFTIPEIEEALYR